MLDRISKTFFTPLLLLGAMQTMSWAGDLSRYRQFQLGSTLPVVAKQTGMNPSEARAVHSRPALIQELEWRPQSVNASAAVEPALAVVFQFFNGTLFQITVKYDRYETEGLTTEDLVEAVSKAFGTAAEIPAPGGRSAPERQSGQEEPLAQWQDAQYSFELFRSAYGHNYTLAGVLKRLREPAQAAVAEAQRLDKTEAPQREADRLAASDEQERVKLGKARLVNKKKFRP